MRASLTALAIALLCVAAIAVTGCGLKGDLYLPDNDTSAAPETAEEKEDDNDLQTEAPKG
ncbi:MAG: lipoprotein [Xanthomonadales bacterium]|nr:lipoprotein [Xanthomonadales bacterium]